MTQVGIVKENGSLLFCGVSSIFVIFFLCKNRADPISTFSNRGDPIFPREYE